MTTRYKYFDLRNAAWIFLLVNDVRSYPLDLQRIIKDNKWHAKSYQDLNIKPERASEVVYTKNQIVILFDETIKRNVLRVKIAHEIGHIIMKHYGLSDMPQYEKEAKMFARRILMPITLIHNLKLTTPYQIIRKCEVTYYEAQQRLDRYNKDLKTRQKFDTHELEKLLKEQLKL